MFLTTEEVIFLTGKKHRSTQVMALRHMGIEHRIRPDGEVLVARSHIEKIFGGDSKSETPEYQIEPNWDGLKLSNERSTKKRNSYK